MASISELAKKLGVSRIRVYQIIDDLPDSKKPQKNEQGRFIIDDNAIETIKTQFNSSKGKSGAKKQAGKPKETVLNSDLTLQKAFNTLQQQLNKKDQQIDDLNERLKYEQQLHLNVQNQLALANKRAEEAEAQLKLESKTVDQTGSNHTAPNEASNEPETPAASITSEPTRNRKKGWWAHLWGKK